MTIQPKMQPKFVPPGGGMRLAQPGGGLSLLKVLADETMDRFSLVELTVDPGVGPPLHVHESEDEVFIVLEGTMSFHADGKRIDANAGSVVFAPRHVPHTFKNCTNTPARMMLLLSPGKNFETFYINVCSPTADGQLPSDDVMIAKIMQTAEKHGMSILGPSPL